MKNQLATLDNVERFDSIIDVRTPLAFTDKPINWKPLIYCWRGGKRSGAMTTWFRLIGWKACQLEGGY